MDPIKSLKQELEGQVAAEKRVRRSAESKEAIIDEATQDRDALLLAASMFRDNADKMRQRLRALEEEAERKAKEAQGKSS